MKSFPTEETPTSQLAIAGATRTMRWPGRPDKSDSSSEPAPSAPEPSKKPISWDESLNKIDWEHFKEPRNWIPTLLVTATALATLQLYRSYLRRIPGTGYISPSFFHRRSLYGRVTSVGDGDNFHLFHTPGGRLAGWGWIRKVPTDRKDLKGRTVRHLPTRPMKRDRALGTDEEAITRFLSASPASTPRKARILAGRHSRSPRRPSTFCGRTFWGGASGPTSTGETSTTEW